MPRKTLRCRGIKPERLEELNERLLDERDYSEHIGLFNTHKRLKLMYGEAYSLKIRSKYGWGTVIYISIPSTEET